eukprot:GGOE01036060.1.p1 GENE.GGOE01036060.1~~GGOE01036060.1.p1  ORF type:complete len:224 (-),score=43.35 GGOE01036060.1:196-867(-)
MLHRFAPAVARSGIRGFFKDGFRDNASLELVYRVILKSPAVSQKLLEFYAKNLDQLSVESLSALKGTTVGIPLQPYLGDPHRVLLAYSLLPHTVEHEADGNPVVETKIGDEEQKIKIVDSDIITFLAKEILAKLGQETTPQGARQYLDSLVEGAEALYAKIAPVEPSPLEKAIAEINEELKASGIPLDNCKNMANPKELHDLKFAHLPHPITKKVEGKFKYFT